MTYHVCSYCWDFTGTRRACQRFIKARGNPGFYFITTISSLEEVRRLYGN